MMSDFDGKVDFSVKFVKGDFRFWKIPSLPAISVYSGEGSI